MSIKKLDSKTINQIAAGEVIERPSNIVKELVENSIDAGANYISVSIENGGKSKIDIVDNGSGINKDELPLSVLRHATSKIRTIEDLNTAISLGFRGEALASISSVSRLSIHSKEVGCEGYKYIIEGNDELSLQMAPCNKGTRMIVEKLFYNVPARKKFLKSDLIEQSQIEKIITGICLSHPEIKIDLQVDNRNKISTIGDGKVTNTIYSLLGSDISENLIFGEIKYNEISIKAYMGKPSIGRGNRGGEYIFVNNRPIESISISKAIEEAYEGFLMQHKFPYVFLYIEIPPDLVDINIHPTKSQIKIFGERVLLDNIIKLISSSLLDHKIIPTVKIGEVNNKNRLESIKNKLDLEEYLKNKNHTSDKFYMEEMMKRVSGKYDKDNREFIKEDANKKLSVNDKIKNSINNIKNEENIINNEEEKPNILFNNINEEEDQSNRLLNDINNEKEKSNRLFNINNEEEKFNASFNNIENKEIYINRVDKEEYKNYVTEFNRVINNEKNGIYSEIIIEKSNTKEKFLQEDSFINKNFNNEVNGEIKKISINDISDKELIKSEIRIIGQVFNTYIILECNGDMLIVDQHAAHEKIIYEELMNKINNKEASTQILLKPYAIKVDSEIKDFLNNNMDIFKEFGFDIDDFSEDSLIIRGIPTNLEELNSKEKFLMFLDYLMEGRKKSNVADFIKDKIATSACKAAVKGNDILRDSDMKLLVEKLLKIENPYNCPHGRPSIIKMSKKDMEKEFKRIL